MQANKIYPPPDTTHLHLAGQFVSVSQLLDVLKVAKINYLVLRGWDKLPDIELGGNSDLDVLVAEADLPKFYATTRAVTPNALLSIRLCLVRIADSYLKIDVRSPHDGYLPADLALQMLMRKQVRGNYFIPDEEMYFWSYLYHRVFQKPFVSAPQLTELKRLAPSDFPDDALVDVEAIKQVFIDRGWSPSEPLDEWVWWKYRDNSKHYPEWVEYQAVSSI